MKIAAMSLLAVLVGGASSSSAAVVEAAAADKPNIVMLFVDDLGYGDTGFNGHPTTKTPNIDALAHGGKILSTWYSGCPVCSGSRAALMTGRQYTRTGVPGVFGPTVGTGLPLTEITVAEQLKTAGYRTAIQGKWHLGQRPMFLPGSRGFDEYLGIPYSDDMGEGRRSSCNNETVPHAPGTEERYHKDRDGWMWRMYEDMGYTMPDDGASGGDPLLPLVYQQGNITHVVEQPLDLTTLAYKYQNFTDSFLKESAESNAPFFLYMPFSHVHTTAANQPEKQYAGCDWQNSTTRGPFGDALAEVDWQVGELVNSLDKYQLRDNTLILFTGDNGPWMIQDQSGGSPGLLVGRYSGYWNTGKGSTWEGGIREAAFANWPGKITPATRTSEIVSSMDLFPTVSALAGVELPAGVTYDGKDMSAVLFDDKGTTPHDFLFFYGGAGNGGRKCAGCTTDNGPTAVRHGRYKAHYGTGPGLGGCKDCPTHFYPKIPLIFDVEKDPQEAFPLTDGATMPSDPELAALVKAFNDAYDHEQLTFTWGNLTTPPAQPDELENHWSICCDALPYGGNLPVASAKCDCNGSPYPN